MILLTGGSGFLGKEIYNYLKNTHKIYSIGRRMDKSHSIDITNPFILNQSFDCVIHAAGKAHLVPQSEEDIQAFWDVNVLGTRNLLHALEVSPPKRFVFISSVAVYGNSFGVLLNEQTPILARNPYGQSKAQAEAEVLNWCNRNSVTCTILRLPLVYGINPPGNLRQMLDGILNGYYFNIAGGNARKSIVRAEDVARFIMAASEVGGIFNLTDGFHPSFKELSNFMAKSIGRRRILNMPLWFARFLSFIGDQLGPRFPLNSEILDKITSDLTFDDSFARTKFGWSPQPVVPQAN